MLQMDREGWLSRVAAAGMYFFYLGDVPVCLFLVYHLVYYQRLRRI